MKRVKTKFVAGIVSLCIMFTGMPMMEATAAAATPEQQFRELYFKLLETGDDSEQDVSQLNLPYMTCYDIWCDVKDNEGFMAYECYEAHHLLKSFKTEVRSNEPYLLRFELVDTDENFLKRYEKTKQIVAEVQSQFDSQMTDLDKLLWCHEYVVSHMYYKNNDTTAVHKGGWALTEGYGVCQGYARAMMILLKAENIPCVAVAGGNHEWVRVQIDGEWYHVDPTWDDTNSNKYGTHYFLMRNDTEFGETLSRKHDAWTNTYSSSLKKDSIVSESEAYTEWYVHDIKTKMYYYDGNWYYVDGNSIKGNNIAGTEETVVCTGNSLVITEIKDGVLNYTSGGVNQTLDLKNGAGSIVTVTKQPTLTATVQPTLTATVQPTLTATKQPTLTATVQPTLTVTRQPTVTATKQPTLTATVQPTLTATRQPTVTATKQPTLTATEQPTATVQPTLTVTRQPTVTATEQPTATVQPTLTATEQPTATVQPTMTATRQPTMTATVQPTLTATRQPTLTATVQPTMTATKQPTVTATKQPTATVIATRQPTVTETVTPVVEPTSATTATATPKATATVKPTVTGIPSVTLQLTSALQPSISPKVTVTSSPSQSEEVTVTPKATIKPGVITVTVTPVTKTEGYKITYKLNGGKNSNSNPSSYQKSNIILKAPRRTGYQFLGWYTDAAYKNEITKITPSMAKDITIYAKWKKITLKRPVLTSVKNNKSRTIKVQLKQRVNGAKGYEISYSTDKKFKKSVKKLTFKTTRKTITKLKKNKTYYVKVRAYQLDSAGKKVYSKYSNVKKVKISK